MKLLYLVILGSCCDATEVVTPLGVLGGYLKTSQGGRKFLAFEGVPYAKPPIGNMRFEQPLPMEKWKGIWHAQHLIQCAQTTEAGTIVGAEDCLYLNIYVPRKNVNTSEKLHVIVDIHGGSFMYGSGHEYAFPGYLMDYNVIFVTMNYRLGVLGFLTTEDNILLSNIGLKDQVVALKWVQSNIASFGGDPNSVTITGVSAGGASVHLHYMSNLSSGLFKRGLSRSGCALNPWVMQKEASLKAKTLALAVGCPQQPSQHLKDCLKQRHYKDLLNQVKLFFGYKTLPFSPFGPVVEKGPNAFLTAEPYELLLTKQVKDLPWMTSFVKQDGFGLVAEFESNTKQLNLLWKKVAPFILNYNYSVPKSKWETVAQKIRDFYIGQNESFTDKNFDKLIKLATDRTTIDGTVKAVNLQTRANKAPVFLYELSYTGQKKVISHYDDNQYFFYNTSSGPTDDDLKIKDILVKFLVNYAKDGNPANFWKPVKANELNILHISGFNDNDVELETRENLGNEHFWDSLNFLENQHKN